MKPYYAAILPVAGLSSRMGDFKPLMEINGIPMIVLTAQSVIQGGVQALCAVTGREAHKIEAALCSDTLKTLQHKQRDEQPNQKSNVLSDQSSNVLSDQEPQEIFCVHNAHYATSDMLSSIQLGFGAVLKLEPTCQAIFVLPGDIPGVSAHTFGQLKAAYEEQEGVLDKSAGPLTMSSSPKVFVPTYKGRRGHPLLVSASCFDAVLSFKGEGGLRQALQGVIWQEVAVDDQGILLDADTPDAFAELTTYLQALS